MAKVRTRDSDGRFTPEEAQRRFEAALRGARITGHKPMAEITSKKKAGKGVKVGAQKKGPGK